MAENVAIIGAGLAGAVCARALADAGRRVCVFEKSGGTGGRLSTRRSAAGEFDHGAQYLTARGAAMGALLARLADAGAIAPWTPDGKDRPGHWHVGLPGMSGAVKPLLAGLDVRLRAPVEALRLAADAGVEVITGDGARHGFDRVIVTAPSPQAHALTGALDARFDALGGIAYAPCWAAMVAFDRPLPALPDLWRGADDAPLALVARNGSKPGRTGETFVIHAGGAWSARNLERPAGPVLEEMVAALSAPAKGLPAPVHAVAHRWRHARVDAPLGAPFIESACGRIAVCGDGMLGGRAEAAVDSADALVTSILGQGGQVTMARP